MVEGGVEDILLSNQVWTLLSSHEFDQLNTLVKQNICEAFMYSDLFICSHYLKYMLKNLLLCIYFIYICICDTVAPNTDIVYLE